MLTTAAECKKPVLYSEASYAPTASLLGVGRPVSCHKILGNA